MVGESTVGKTSILTVANVGQFDANATPTVGACFVSNNYNFHDRSIRLNLWDTAGQERFRALAPMYYRDMDIGCLVYAIDSWASFEAVESWYKSIVDQISNRPCFYLIGNKTDLESMRQVPAKFGREMAARIGAEFYEVSAKEDWETIVRLFQHIAESVSEPLLTPNRVPEEQPPDESQKSCC
jgi:small GTP-binding protein